MNEDEDMNEDTGLTGTDDVEETEPEPKVKKPRKPRTPNPDRVTKESQVIDLLRRPEGATVAQIMEITGWKEHTVRGNMSGSLKKAKGLNVVAERPLGCKTCIYYIRDQKPNNDADPDEAA